MVRMSASKTHFEYDKDLVAGFYDFCENSFALLYEGILGLEQYHKVADLPKSFRTLLLWVFMTYC